MKPDPASAGLLIMALIAVFCSDAQQIKPTLLIKKTREETMNNTKTNKAIVRNLYENALNKHQLNTLDKYIAADYTGPKGAKGPAGFGAPLQLLINAFPDIEWHIEDIIAENDNVMIRWTLRGTHRAAYNEVAATGRKISIYGIGIFTLYNGMVIRGTSYTDRLGFLQDLGVLPADIGSPASAARTQQAVPASTTKQ